MKKRFLVGFAGILAFFVLSLGSLAGAQTAQQQVCAGLGAAAGTGGNGCDDPAGESSLDNTVANVINILSVLVGVIAVIMLIVGGLKYVASQGESGSIASAKNTIIYALVGLIIVALAQVIVRFVVDRAIAPAPETPSGPTAPTPNGRLN